MDEFHKRLKQDAENKRSELLTPLYAEFKTLIERQKEMESRYNLARHKGIVKLEEKYGAELNDIKKQRMIDDKMIKTVEGYSDNQILSNYEKIYSEIKHRFKGDIVEEHKYKKSVQVGLVVIIFTLLGLEISKGIEAEFTKNILYLFILSFALLVGFAIMTKHKRRLVQANA